MAQNNAPASVASLRGAERDEAIETFRNRMISEGIFNEARHTDHVLRRFLKARRWDQEASFKMISNTESWRKEFKVEDILKEYAYPENMMVQTYLKRYHHKTDKIGRPIYFEKYKDLDLKKMMSITDSERLVKHHVREYEKFIDYKLAACSKKSGTHLDQGFTVLDLQGVPMTSFNSVRTLVNQLSQISQDHYPETMGILFIINAPWMFTAVWSVIKGWLDEQTVKKIHLLGSDYKDTLLQHVDPGNLPAAYGGTCKCPAGCENSDIGPWNDGTVEEYPKVEWEFTVLRDGGGHVTDAVQAMLDRHGLKPA